MLTGVSDAKAVALAYPDRRPSYLGLDLTDLMRVHPGPVHQPTGAWTSGESAAFRVAEDGRVMRDEEPVDNGQVLSLEDYRALVAAVWDARDRGVFVHLPDLQVVREVETSAPDAPEDDADILEEEPAAPSEEAEENLYSAQQVSDENLQEEAGEEVPQPVDSEDQQLELLLPDEVDSERSE